MYDCVRVSPWQRQNWSLDVYWINPSLCSKLYWQFLFHKLLHTSAFCLMVNSNSLIVWIQVRYICFTYSCNIKFCHVKILYILGITALLYILSSDQFTPPPRPVEKPFRCCIADIFRGKNHFSSRRCIPGQLLFSTCIVL